MNWSIDTDKDGTPDEEEMEARADNTHPDHALSEPFVSDSDNNHVRDDLQKDHDKDGIPNPDDAGRRDPLIKWQRGPSARYALFQLIETPPEIQAVLPIQVTDRCEVAFNLGIWSNNTFHSLTSSHDRIRDARVFGVGPSGRILGMANIDFNEDDNAEQLGVVYWDSVESNPMEIKKDTAAGTIHASPSYLFAYGQLSAANLLGEDDKFFAPKSTLEWQIPNDPPNPHKPYNLGNDRPNTLWQLPNIGSDDQSASETAALPWPTHRLDDNRYWGVDYSPEGASKLKLNEGGQTQVANHGKHRLSITPTGGYLAAASAGTDALMTDGNIWKPAIELKDALDMSRDGWAILQYSAEVWMNGRALAPKNAFPGISETWQGHIDLTNSSPKGNILAARYLSGGSSRIYGLGVPFHLEDVVEATGVDSFSLVSTQPGPAVAEKHWIMVPSGGQNTVRFCTTAWSSTQPPRGTHFDLQADDVSFSPSKLSSNRQEVTISAPAGLDTSETDLNISLNTQQALSKPIGLKIMKQRTVNAKVHKIETIRKDAQGNVIYRRAPGMVPTEQDLELYLNSVYSPQLNLTFDITMNPPETGQCLEVEWDKGTGADYGDANAAITPGDKILQMAPDENVSIEEQIIFNATYDQDSEINIYIIGIGSGSLAMTGTDQNGAIIQSGGAEGIAKPFPANAVFIHGDAYFVTSLLGNAAEIQKNTIAHEVATL